MLSFLINTAFASNYMPYEGTEIAARVDNLYAFLIISSLISFILLIGGMIFFAVKYKRRGPNDDTPNITHNNTLEFLWSFIPFMIFLFVFAWGLFIHQDMRAMPKDAFEVNVTAYQWGWKFNYKSGIQTDNEFAVPVGEPVKLIMHSTDVLHSFFVPAFRIKQDVIPGRYTALWFEAKTPGDYQVFCAEYCGTSHSNMLATIKVLPPDEFEQWLRDKSKTKDLPLAEKGRLIIEEGACSACHNTSEKRKIGPGFAGLWGKKREFEDGSSTVADADYVRESIQKPSKRIVKGFPNQMNVQNLNDEEISAVIEYFKTQSEKN